MPRRTGVPSRRAAHAALIVLLAIALQLAPAAGLRHRITHGWPRTPQAPAAADDDNAAVRNAARVATRDAARDPAPAHACQAYDAATLAVCLPAAATLPLPLAAPALRQSFLAPSPPPMPAAPHSLPRGPPAPALS